ncbi:Hypothetical predicted protein [Lynx pardinus]|uniref:Uncharacterized protein n=1 Tax=Lynx pardinus TaxID=191816 RepID=A0A485PI72_LYNPA|nr:Hypothetical predicted protein [Lynx pardinus]
MMPKRKAAGDSEGDKAKVKDDHRGLQGYLLNLLESQSPDLRRPLQRRETWYPKGKRGQLIVARMGITLQNIELPKQTGHRKLKVLGMPSEMWAFWITMYSW